MCIVCVLYSFFSGRTPSATSSAFGTTPKASTRASTSQAARASRESQRQERLQNKSQVQKDAAHADKLREREQRKKGTAAEPAAKGAKRSASTDLEAERAAKDRKLREESEHNQVLNVC